MAEKTSYRQLQLEEQLAVTGLHLQSSRMRAMARILGRSRGSSSRALTRNSSLVGYLSMPAAAHCSARCSASRHLAKL
jgi:transposase, IS30 family